MTNKDYEMSMGEYIKDHLRHGLRISNGSLYRVNPCGGGLRLSLLKGLDVYVKWKFYNTNIPKGFYVSDETEVINIKTGYKDSDFKVNIYKVKPTWQHYSEYFIDHHKPKQHEIDYIKMVVTEPEEVAIIEYLSKTIGVSSED